MRCEEIMNRDITYVRADEPVERAARTMRNKDVGFLPVCKENKKVIGVLTDRDVVIRVVAESKPAMTPVERVFTPRVVSCSPSDDVEKAERLMADNQVSRIVCLDDTGQLLGVISLSDIAEREDSFRTSRTLRVIKKEEALRPTAPIRQH